MQEWEELALELLGRLLELERQTGSGLLVAMSYGATAYLSGLLDMAGSLQAQAAFVELRKSHLNYGN